MSLSPLTRIRTILMDVFSVSGVNRLGRETGQTLRLRTVTPHGLFVAIVSALAASRVKSLADLLRTFNHQHGVSPATIKRDGALAAAVEKLKLTMPRTRPTMPQDTRTRGAAGHT